MSQSKSDKQPDSNRGLRLVVISMGLVLIGGTILLFILAIKKMAGGMDTSGAGPQGASGYIPREYRSCARHELALGQGESLQSVEFEGIIARLVIKAPEGATHIRLVQSCTGEVLGGLAIHPAR